ncbi:MAG: hypothetical protein KDJ55_06125 [Rhodobiaceae bacterium]|nr:hypothetical protein [Rhodobiaceae bacterium]MCC0050634.1 hypothetical protein [Rhodobiaceae bacterium]MCC0059837.1 hypothetical protein [Rhodobiaceae bacterium]
MTMVQDRRDDLPQEKDETFFKRRRSRSIAIALVLAGLVVLFYVVTLVKMGAGIFNRAL